MKDQVQETLLKLLRHCREEDWAGWEPYDVLNSRFVASLPGMRHRIPRLVLTQFLKRSPVNLRPLLGIPKTQNPKALAVFLSAFVRLARTRLLDGNKEADPLVARLVELRSPDTPYWCWGYNFPWQTRRLLVPRWSPNVVCTTFVADALLDAYEAWGDGRHLEMAASAADYIVRELYWEEGEEVGFCYPMPSVRSRVHNSNLLAAALLCRLSRLTGDKSALGPALKAARYSSAKQLPDGRWPYGEHPTQHWTDNFHTGYNLGALDRIGRELATDEFEGRLRKGYDFYKSHFFLEDGSVRYYHDRTYPIDTHCVAQGILTPIEMERYDPEGMRLVPPVLRWALAHMWDKRGFFYYRVLRTCTIRTSYMRWTQAWMVSALSALLERETAGAQTGRQPSEAA